MTNPNNKPKLNPDKRKDYTLSDLMRAFEKAGIPHDRSWYYRQEEKGNLVIPRSPTDYKKVMGIRPIGFVRQLTKKQIEDIVKAFSPGGSGFYDYRKHENS
jgi:hypothetical protein